MGPTEKRREYYPQASIFYIWGIESSHIGPYLENKVDGTRQLLYHPREISLQWRPCANAHYHEDVFVSSAIVFQNTACFFTLYPCGLKHYYIPITDTT